MPASKAQQKAVAKYMKANYDEMKIRPAKELGEKIRAAAVAAGQSNQQYILQAVKERMQRDMEPDDGDPATREHRTVSSE